MIRHKRRIVVRHRYGRKQHERGTHDGSLMSLGYCRAFSFHEFGGILTGMTPQDQEPKSPAVSGRYGVRVIAVLEAAKALMILATGFGLFALVHRDAEAIAMSIVKHLHVNPASKYPQIFLQACRHITDGNLRMLALLALFDSILRGIEAVGLWRGRDWGKWLGVVSGTIYIPFEIYELIRHASGFKVAALVINLVIVAYLGYLLRQSLRLPGDATSGTDAGTGR